MRSWTSPGAAPPRCASSSSVTPTPVSRSRSWSRPGARHTARAASTPGVFTRYELGDFGRAEAAEYVRRWFRWHGQPAPAVSGFPGEGTYDAELRSSPLLLSLVCTLYHETGVLPRNRVDLYERCTDMLIRIRDEAKEIRRELKAEVLIRPLIQHLALWMLSLPDAGAPVAENDLTREVERFLRNNTPGPAGDPRAPAEEFVEFCRERAWVLSSVPGPRGRNEYRFTHQAFLEYHAAAGLVRQAKTPEALATALAPRIITHSWHFSQLAIAVMTRSTPGMADRVCELLLRQEDLPGDRGELLTFLTTLLRDIALSPDTVRGLTRSVLRHRIVPDLQTEVTHPLGMLLFVSGGGHVPVVTDHREPIRGELTSYISAMAASGDTAARAEGLRMLLEARDASLSDYWKEWSQDQAARHAVQIRECSVWSREIRTLALTAGLISLNLAMSMPGALDALLEPFDSMLDSNLQFPYPVWMYMQADGMKAAGEAAEREFATIGRYVAEHPELPWAQVDSHGFSILDLYHQSALAEIGAPLDEMAGFGLAAMHTVCYELFNSTPEDFIIKYPDMYGRYLPDVPMPSRLRAVLRNWAEHKVDVTLPQ